MYVISYIYLSFFFKSIFREGWKSRETNLLFHTKRIKLEAKSDLRICFLSFTVLKKIAQHRKVESSKKMKIIDFT